MLAGEAIAHGIFHGPIGGHDFSCLGRLLFIFLRGVSVMNDHDVGTQRSILWDIDKRTTVQVAVYT